MGTRLIDKILDYTTRSWFAFWATFWLIGAYVLWNVRGAVRFDPYPFVFLMGLITVFSYLQNIIIMTIQRKAELSQRKVEAAQHKQSQYMLDIMEVVKAEVQLIEAYLLAKPEKK